MKIVFFGTPEFSVPFLRALIEAPSLEVIAVVTQPDKPVGREKTLTPPPTKILALQHGLPVLQFATLKSDTARETLAALHADCFVVVAYGKLIPQPILELPPLGCINVHPSLLPKYRGPSPIQAAIANGDDKTAVSIMLLDAGMDTGPLLAQEPVEVLPTDTSPTLSERLTKVGAPLLVSTLVGYEAGSIKPMPQSDAGATITKLLDREDGLIDWTDSAEEIDQKIRAYTPWPGCYTVLNKNGKELRVKILAAQLVDGKLAILQVQPEGKQPMSYQEFQRGYGQIVP